jgi:hypothetical protein
VSAALRSSMVLPAFEKYLTQFGLSFKCQLYEQLYKILPPLLAFFLDFNICIVFLCTLLLQLELEGDMLVAVQIMCCLILICTVQYNFSSSMLHPFAIIHKIWHKLTLL